MLVIFGFDGVYLLGFLVVKVVNIECDSVYFFVCIFCVLVVGVENFGEVMVFDLC